MKGHRIRSIDTNMTASGFYKICTIAFLISEAGQNVEHP
jgi:hypothetical protein